MIALLAGGVALPAYAGIAPVLRCLQADTDVKHLSRDFFETRVGKVFRLPHQDSRTLLLKGVENACGALCREQFLA